MSETSTATTADDTRNSIIEAAEARFEHFGYRKTTMAEIASDLGMSAANLYRYFENKEDIVATCASRCMTEHVALLREVVRKQDTSAPDRLEEFILETVRYTHDQTQGKPRINELVETITSERPELVHQKIEAMESMLAEILAHGNATGEFDIEDVVKTAKTVHATLVLFDVPIFVGLYPQEEYERIARAVSHLLVRGLAKR